MFLNFISIKTTLQMIQQAVEQLEMAKVNTKNLHSIVQERILLQNTYCSRNFLQLKNIFATIILCTLMSVASEAQVAIVHKNRFIAAVLRLVLVKLDRKLLSPCVCVSVLGAIL
jgi:hypothetical protein